MTDPTVYSGIIQDMGGAVYNLYAYGAQGDGVTDDTDAVDAAIAAVPDGGTLYIPTGTFLIRKPLVINTPISIAGSGSSSALWLKLEDPTQTGVTIGSTNVQNQSYRNFGIFGPARPDPSVYNCQYGLAVYGCFNCRFENVHVRPGSWENAVVISGCENSYFNFIVQNNDLEGYPPGSGAWNGAGILVASSYTITSPTNSSNTITSPTNSSVFDCIVAGSSGGGLAVQQQSDSGGDNTITGTYEGFMQPSGSVYGTGYALLIEGCMGFRVVDTHVEDSAYGTLITNSKSFTIRDSGFFSDAPEVENLAVQSNCSDFVIDQVLVGSLSIDSTCSKYQVQNVVGANLSSPASVQDSFVTMFHNPAEGITASGMARFTTENLVPNGDLSRWPLDFTCYGVQPGLTQTGAGQSDPTSRFNQYAANVTGGGNSSLVINVPNSCQYGGQPVTIWADIKCVSGGGISLGAMLNYESQSPSLSQTLMPLSATVPAGETDWVRVAVTGYPSQTYQTTDQTTGQQIDLTLTSWSILISPASDGDYEYYLGGVGALVGVAAPMGTFAPLSSFQQGLQVSGKRVQYGSAAPTQGAWQPGDIVYNTAPAAGGYVGWVCTTAGSPGTWNSFGAISS